MRGSPLCCYLPKALWHSWPWGGTTAPCLSLRCCWALVLNHNSPCVRTQAPNRGVRWQQCGAKAGKEKPGGPREPGIRDPSQGGKEVVRDRPLVSEAPNPQCLLHGPIKPHLGNLIPKMTLLRMVKLFLNLSHSITNNS